MIRFIEVEAHCGKLHEVIERIIPTVKRVFTFNEKKLIILFQETRCVYISQFIFHLWIFCIFFNRIDKVSLSFNEFNTGYC